MHPEKRARRIRNGPRIEKIQRVDRVYGDRGQRS